MSEPLTNGIVTVTLNPAIDQTAAIPNFHRNTVNRVQWEQADAGGKGINVAAFLADYGAAGKADPAAQGFSPITATGFLGEANVQLFETLFHQKGIVDRCLRLPGKTRVNVKVVDPVQAQVTDINFPGIVASDADLAILSTAILHLAKNHDWFIFAGSLPTGLPTTTYRDLIQPLKAQGKTVVLDTSGDALAAALVAQPDLIKPNQMELEMLVGHSLEDETTLLRAARQLMQDFCLPRVVVSLGAGGAIFVDGDDAVHAQPPSVEIKSTVGAGDAMVAGTIAGLIQGYSLGACATLATAFSLGALSQLGPHLPDRVSLAASCDRIALRFL